MVGYEGKYERAGARDEQADILEISAAKKQNDIPIMTINLVDFSIAILSFAPLALSFISKSHLNSAIQLFFVDRQQQYTINNNKSKDKFLNYGSTRKDQYFDELEIGANISIQVCRIRSSKNQGVIE